MPDVLTQWLDLLDDRMTHAAWWTSPPQAGLQQLWGVRVRSPEEALELAEMTLGPVAATGNEETHRGRRFVKLAHPDQAVCLATLDRYLVVASSPEAMRRATEASQDPTARLAEQLDYRLVASRAQHRSKDGAAGLQFVRPRGSAVADSAPTSACSREVARFLADAATLSPGGAVLFETADAVVYEAFLLRRNDQ